MSTSTDIVIVGGGLVGATLAKALSTLDLKVTLIEKNFLKSTVSIAQIIDQRALALNFGTLSILKNLLHLDLSHEGARVEHIYVSDEHGFGRIALDAGAEHLPYFGCVIPILKLTEILQAAVLNDPKITCISGTCTNLIQEENYVICEVGEQRIQAKMLIGADGAHSKVRELMQIANEVKDYQESALIGNVKVQGLAPHTAFERFTTSGPVALLPFDQEHMTLVWVMPTTLVSMRQALPAALLLQDLQNIMGYRSGKFLALGQLQAFPLQQVVSSKTYEGRVGLLGNAAHSLHPVAGQGFNLSMRDIFGFYQTMKRFQDCLDRPQIIWQEYLRVRHHDQVRTAGITDVLVQLFTKKNPLMHFARNALMLNLELCPPAKTALNHMMVGLT